MSAPFDGISQGTIDAAKNLVYTSASLSLVGTSLMLIMYVMWPRCHTPGSKLVVYRACADFLASIFWLLVASNDVSKEFFEGDAKGACLAQAIGLQYFNVASQLWIAALAVDTYLNVVKNVNTHMYAKYCNTYLFVCWGLPLIPTIWLAADGKFGYSDVWCWISLGHKKLYFAFVYGPFLFVLLLISVLYTLIRVHSIQQGRSLRQKTSEIESTIERRHRESWALPETVAKRAQSIVENSKEAVELRNVTAMLAGCSAATTVDSNQAPCPNGTNAAPVNADDKVTELAKKFTSAPNAQTNSDLAAQTSTRKFVSEPGRNGKRTVNPLVNESLEKERQAEQEGEASREKMMMDLEASLVGGASGAPKVSSREEERRLTTGKMTPFERVLQASTYDPSVRSSGQSFSLTGRPSGSSISLRSNFQSGQNLVAMNQTATAQKYGIYVFVFVLTWITGLIYRSVQVSNDDAHNANQHISTWLILTSILLPLHGFLNFLVYSMSKTMAKPEKLTQFLKDEVAVTLFRQFLAKEFCEENLDFWLEVQRFKSVVNETATDDSISSEERMERMMSIKDTAIGIYNTYVHRDALFPINISVLTRNAVDTRFAQCGEGVHPEMFSEAEREVATALELDLLRRFEKSSHYAELLAASRQYQYLEGQTMLHYITRNYRKWREYQASRQQKSNKVEVPSQPSLPVSQSTPLANTLMRTSSTCANGTSPLAEIQHRPRGKAVKTEFRKSFHPLPNAKFCENPLARLSAQEKRRVMQYGLPSEAARRSYSDDHPGDAV